jgi:Spy/CpxP family protein refolding chaperone
MRGAAMLDEKQREVIREAAQPYREELRKLDEQLAAAQRELFKAMLAEKPDEKVMRAKAEAVAKIQVEQTLLRAKIVAAVVPTLKPEQREQLQTNPWMLNMLTGGLGMGMSGMRAPAVRTDAAPAREGQRDRPQP